MLSILDDVEHWSARACEHRALVSQFRDPEAKRILLAIAIAYEEMAVYAEKRVTGRSPCETARAERPLRWASYEYPED